MMKKILIFIILIQIVAPLAVFAYEETEAPQSQGYILLEKLPGVGGAPTMSAPSLSDYLQWVFAFAISIAGILAVLMLVIGGIQYITAYGNPSQVENAKNRIWQALLGLLLAISAWLILYTINPDLAKGQLTIPQIQQPQQQQSIYERRG